MAHLNFTVITDEPNILTITDKNVGNGFDVEKTIKNPRTSGITLLIEKTGGLTTVDFKLFVKESYIKDVWFELDGVSIAQVPAAGVTTKAYYIEFPSNFDEIKINCLPGSDLADTLIVNIRENIYTM